MKKLAILFLANSFADDTIEYMPKIATEFGYDLDLYNLYIGGCDIEKHINNLVNNLCVYELRVYNKEKEVWETIYNTCSTTFISSKAWDYIVLQQSSYYSGLPNGLDHIQELVDLIKEKLVDKKTKFIWNMTWAYPKYSDLEIFEKAFGKSQIKMHQDILKNVQEVIVPNKDFIKIIPNGTALMQARKFIKDELLHRDGFHLSYDYGRFLAGLTASATLLNINIDKEEYLPNNVPEEIRDIFKICVKEALAHPFETPVSRKFYE